MTKRLVYNFYITKDSINNDVNRLHFHCLNMFSHIFDELFFVLSIDDVDDLETIREYENKLLNLHTKGSITFKIIKNGELRETQTFKEEVIDKMPENKLVFFAHNKGVTNVNTFDVSTIYYWIVAMYYFSLYFEDEIDYFLINRPSMAYGSLLTKNDETNIKYGWAYIGTYFWINSSILYDYIKKFNIEEPKCANRFFDEEYLGNVFDHTYYARSHKCRYIVNAYDYYQYTKEYIDSMFEQEDVDKFKIFYNNIIDELYNDETLKVY